MSRRARAEHTHDHQDQTHRPCSCGGCRACQAARLRRDAEAGAPVVAAPAALPSVVRDVLSTPGVALSAPERAYYEPRFGRDLGDVRLHTDSRAAESARAVRANAYTVGDHVVFGAGRYRGDAAGRHLLGHELAHTVQQHGLHRQSTDGTLPDSSTEARLEREAEAAASWIARANAAPLPPLHHAPGAMLLRQDEGASIPPVPQPTPAPQPTRDWLPITPPITHQGMTVTALQQGGDIVAFRVSHFPLPATKGPVADLWTARANAQALEATIDFDGNTPRAGLWQSRDRTDELRSSWLGKLGWTEANVAQNWVTAGGEAPAAGATWRPRAGGATCQMDHIVELQIGGTNSRENIQVLDPEPNRQSGQTIWSTLSSLAAVARESLPQPRPSHILLHFDTVNAAAPGPMTPCMQVEQRAVQARVAPVGPDATGREPYEVRAATARDFFRVNPTGQTDLNTEDNRAPRQIIPGVILNTLTRTTGQAPDTAAGVIDTNNVIGNRQRTRFPIPEPPTPPAVNFTVDRTTRDLRLRRGERPAIDFIFPFLSPVHLDLNYDPATGWSGRGRLTPTLPLLSRVPINVELGDGRLRAFISAPPERLRTPVPGLRFTRAELGVQIFPDFDPRGVLAFEIGPRARPIVVGQIDVTADANGLVLNGPFTVNIPNVEPVQGAVTYQNGELSGFVEITSERIRVPGVQRGTIRAEFSNTGFAVSGGLDLLVANTPIGLRASYREGNWLLTGSATVEVPGGALDPVQLTVNTDFRRVWGQGRTAVRIRGLSGPVTVRYENERWSGEATLPFRFGRATGSVTATLHPSGAITGRGTVTYPITDRMTATIGVLLREDRTVRVEGELTFAPIQLFERFPRQGGRRTLYTFAPPGIPIWGIPLGPLGTVGLTAQIRFRIGVDYGIGPGEVRNLRARAAFDLFGDSPNFEFHGTGQIYVPFNAGFFLGVDGAIALDAAVASLSSGLGVTANIGLRGQIQLDAAVDYMASVFALRARLEASGNPELVLAIDAFIRATVLGQDLYEQRWNLANFRFGSDLRFGLAFPFEYASDRPFQPPSLESIEWIYPRDLDTAGMLRRLIT